MISKVMTKFRSKFQFQIPLQFYMTVEKVETCDGNGQKLWQVPPSIWSSKYYKYDNYDKTKKKSFPLLLDPSDKPDDQAIHYNTANFGPLSRGSITNPS